MKKNFKKYDGSTIFHENYHLTQLMEEDRKSKNDYAKYLMLVDYLSDYGIYIGMSTIVRNLDKSKTNIQVYGCKVDKNIPFENINIIDQMYGYEDLLINIGLDYSEERVYAFWYNTTTQACTLERLEYGDIKFTKYYKSFKEMMQDIRKLKSIDKLK